MFKVHRHSSGTIVFLHIIIILMLSLLITIGSYAIVTRRNAPMDPKAVATGQHSLTGEVLVTLPCGPSVNNDFDGSNPKLPEARGIPFNYNYYNPCDGHQILRDGFLKNVGFWVIVVGVFYIIYITKRLKIAKLDR